MADRHPLGSDPAVESLNGIGVQSAEWADWKPSPMAFSMPAAQRRSTSTTASSRDLTYAVERIEAAAPARI